MLCEGQQEVIIIGNGEFGSAIECTFHAFDYIDLTFYTIEEAADIVEVYIEQEGAAVLTADGGKVLAQALKGLEHKGYAAIAHHGPDEIGLGLFRYAHHEPEAKLFIEGDRRLDIFYEDVRGKGGHIGWFCAHEDTKIISYSANLFRKPERRKPDSRPKQRGTGRSGGDIVTLRDASCPLLPDSG